MSNEIIVSPIPEYLKVVLDLSNECNLSHGDIWFRGIARENMMLLPGIKWREINEGVEESMISSFIIHGKSLVNEDINCSWQFYSLMQHYGLPTRLLDWTKSPLIAAYFALEADNNEDRIVWSMDPYELNKLTMDINQVFVPSVHISEETSIDGCLPKVLRKNKAINSQVYPIAIEPPYTNKRVLAQQGCFTVHGSKNEPINSIFEKNGSDRIKKIRFNSDNVAQLRAEIKTFGITVNSIYQDLNSLSKGIISHYA